MVNTAAANEGLEWRMTIASDGLPEAAGGGSTESSGSSSHRKWSSVPMALFAAVAARISTLGKSLWWVGADDPRRVVHGVKVGLALSLVSLFYYTRPLYDGVGGTAMWAVMTVVVVFEYTVGGCICKSFNRAAATLAAGTLSIGFHWVASKSTAAAEPFVLGVSVFVFASAASFTRFIPAVKARFDYGVTIFILTFSLVTVSGYRVDSLVTMAWQRLSTISIGAAISFLVCVLVRPVWAGADLHCLIVDNLHNLACSLQGCVDDYFQEDKNYDPMKEQLRRSQGYKSVLNSKATEESLANLARWEPAHDIFGFKHPWDEYLKVGSAMRYCAYCIEALNGCCILGSEIKAPEIIKSHLRDTCVKLSAESFTVLKELSISMDSMTKSPRLDFLIQEMNGSVEDLHSALRFLPHKGFSAVDLIDSVPLITAATMLIEISTRVEGVVDAVDDLAELAGFSAADDQKKADAEANKQ